MCHSPLVLRDMTSGDPSARPHVARGVAVSVVLVPVMLAGVAVAAVSLAQFFVANLDPVGSIAAVGEPATWLGWAFGGGRGSLARFAAFVAGGMAAALAYAVIVWGFTGRNALR